MCKLRGTGIRVTARIRAPSGCLRFPKPVFTNDTIRTRVTIKDKAPEPKRPGFGKVVEACEVINQRGETVMYCEHVLMVQCRPEDAAAA